MQKPRSIQPIRLFFWAWVGLCYVTMLVRTITDGFAVWTHDTSWIFILQAMYFQCVLQDRWPALTTMLFTPILVAHETMVLLAVVWMTYTNAGILRNAYTEYGYAVTFMGSVALHLLTWCLLVASIAVINETTLRDRTRQYLQGYAALGYTSYYYILVLTTSETLLLSYFFWFAPTQYYQIEHLGDGVVIWTAAVVVAVTTALYWIWVQIPLPAHAD